MPATTNCMVIWIRIHKIYMFNKKLRHLVYNVGIHNWIICTQYIIQVQKLHTAIVKTKHHCYNYWYNSTFYIDVFNTQIFIYYDYRLLLLFTRNKYLLFTIYNIAHIYT